MTNSNQAKKSFSYKREKNFGNHKIIILNFSLMHVEKFKTNLHLFFLAIERKKKKTANRR